VLVTTLIVWLGLNGLLVLLLTVVAVVREHRARARGAQLPAESEPYAGVGGSGTEATF
jgi:hypothetical protein